MNAKDLMLAKAILGGGGGGGTQPQLNAPTISLSGNTITISNPATNGSFVEGYKIFLDGVYSATVSTTTATITDLGSHAVTVKASGTDFEDSAASNSVTIANYSITVSTTHCTASQSNPTSIASGDTATLVFTADTDYEVRASGVTVTNATVVSVDKDTGTVVIGSATGNVTLAVVGEVPPAILTVTGLGNEDPTTVTFTESDATFDWTFPEVTDANNNVFIKIPTMYRKVETVVDGQITSFSISDQQADNTYEPYPCFVDGNSVLPYVLIGKYCCSSTSVANSVNATYASQTLATGRTNARALGTGYQLYDWQLQKLFVDLALMKSQKVNFQDGSTTISEYLGIAQLDQICWVDGICQNTDTWYACNDPTKYASNPSSSQDGYSSLSYGAPTASNEIKALGYDSNNPFVNFPSAVVSNSSMNTYYCDKYYYSSGSHPVLSYVGHAAAYCGLWTCDAHRDLSASYGVRLCYRPISA